jgi:hypothetical protein
MPKMAVDVVLLPDRTMTDLAIAAPAQRSFGQRWFEISRKIRIVSVCA